MTFFKQTLASVLIAAGLFAFAAGDPVVCHWTGAESSDWWNPNNWKEGKVPGRYRTADGGAILGEYGCTAVFGYSTNRLVRCNPDTTSLNSLRLLSIGNIEISGSDAPAYVFGASLDGSPETGFLPLEGGGSIVVSDDVERSPRFAAPIVLGVLETEAKVFTVVNDAKVALCLENLTAYVGVEQYSHKAGSDWYCSTLRYSGSGSVVASYTTFSTYEWSLATELAFSEGGSLCVKSAVENVYQLNATGSARQTLQIDGGASFALDCRKGVIGTVSADLLVTGDGTFVWSATDSSLSVNNPIEVNDGAQLTFDDGITLSHSANDDTRVLDGVTGGGVSFDSSTPENPGTVLMSGKADFPGIVRVAGSVSFECSSIGNAGGAGQTGRGSSVLIGGGARLRYTGEGETSDKTLRLCSTGGTVENVGSGSLVFVGASGEAAADILTISEGGSVGFTGAVTAPVALEAGAALTAPSGSPAYSDIRLLGDSTLNIADGATVTVTAFGSVAGSLNVLGSGAFKATSLAAGHAPGWLTVGGNPAYIDSGHAVTSRSAVTADYQIDVHDDVIPNAVGKVVAISKSAKSTTGPDTLAATSTSVSMLRNRQSAADSVVQIGSFQKLSAEVFAIDSGAKPMTLGDTKNVGTIGPVNSRLELEVLDSNSALSVNSVIDIGSSPLVKSGAGAAKIYSAFEGLVRHWNGPMTFYNLSGNASLTMSGAEGSVYFAGKSSPYSLRTVACDEQSPSGDGLELSTFSLLALSNLQVGSGGILTLKDFNGCQANASLVKTNVAQRIAGFAYVGSNSVGVLRFDGGAFTGRVALAGTTASSSKGALFVRGGELVNLCSSYANAGDWLMNNGYSYIEVTGGKLTVAGDWMCGFNGQANIFIGEEGTIAHSSARQSRFRFGGYDCDASLYVNGGTFDYFDANDFAYIPLNGSTANCTQLSVDEGGNADFGSRYINFSHMDPSSKRTEAVININDGATMRAAYVVRSASRVHVSDGGTASDVGYSNKLAFIEFNGGTWRNGSTSAPFGEKRYGASLVAPTAIWTFEKGATLDISLGTTVTLPPGGSFQAPYGNGLESVRMTSSFAAMSFIGAPSVRIRGDGFGGTAVAIFDAASGKVSEVRVTGRGCGYTTAEADVYYGYSSGETLVATLPVTLSANVSGGLTKTGSGTLVLKGTNTYTGATVVKEGTLKLSDKGVLNAESGISLAGGTFDLNGSSIALADFGGDGTGSIVNGEVSLTGLRIDMDEVKAGNVDTLDFSNPISFNPSATVKLLNATDDTLDRNERYVILKFANRQPETMPEIDPSVYENLSSGWRILVAEDKAILRYTDGSLYIVY